MSEQTGETRAWYVRCGGTVQGPYCAAGVRRYLLLGCVRLSDRVSLDATRWEPVNQCSELIPDAELREVPRVQRRAAPPPLSVWLDRPGRHAAMAEAYGAGGYTMLEVAEAFGVH